MSTNVEKSPKPHVLIEGTDMTGKNTTGVFVRRKLGYSEMYELTLTPNNIFEQRMEDVSTDEKQLLGLLVAYSIIHDIQHAEMIEPTLLVSSHALRAVAVQRAGEYPLADLFEDLLPYYPQFDATILLTASLETKKIRLEGRPDQATNFDKKVYTDPDFVLLMDSIILRHALEIFGATVIDTSPLTPMDVQNQVIQSINTAFNPESRGTKRKQLSFIGNENYFFAELAKYAAFLKRKYKIEI